MPLSSNTEALSVLYQNCLFRSNVRAAVHQPVAQELANHVIYWKQGTPNMALFKGCLKHINAYVLHYGADVEVLPAPFRDFVLVHTVLAGSAEMATDGHWLSVEPGRSAILAPRRSLRLRWHAGTQQLILKIPRTLLRAAAKHAGVPSTLMPGYIISRELSTQWDVLISTWLNLLPRPNLPRLHDGWSEQFEQSLALFLLLHQPEPSAGENDRGECAMAHDSDSERFYLHHAEPKKYGMQIDALLNYAYEKFSAPVAPEDLARAAGVSVRLLNTLCNRHFGIAPMVMLRHIRLDIARSRLLFDPSSNVTDTALACGFNHLGRFSAYYAQRFHERPSVTQKNIE